MQSTFFRTLFSPVLLAVLVGHAQITTASGFAFSIGSESFDEGYDVAVGELRKPSLAR